MTKTMSHFGTQSTLRYPTKVSCSFIIKFYLADIIEIDNLKGLEKLQKLQLDNNIICKIQNLDHLTELRWLDLSFNLIEKIEGLDNLTRLTDLSLFSNRITIIEGLDNLTELNVLSFGQNLVRQHDDAVQYLKKLKNKLEVLKMSDNPYNYVG